MQSVKKSIINSVVVQGHPIRVLQGYAFSISKRVLLFVELCDFLFAEFVFCTLQKPCIKSGKAIVVAGNLEPDQFDQFRLDRLTLPCWQVELACE